MAVQKIIGKTITKFDTKNPNYMPRQKTPKEIDGNINYVNLSDSEGNLYGEQIYQAPTEENGNLKLEEMMNRMMGKIDRFGNVVGETKSHTGTEAVEVDIQREIAIGNVDMNAVKSEVTTGKVLTKKDKLKALRIRERRRKGVKV
ncbi:MAG: hypothetical protein H8D94_00605 [Candidatus Pelagibacter sp.]|nr:hypothetical protein [Candidatus Pelagibacter sp.]